MNWCRRRFSRPFAPTPPFWTCVSSKSKAIIMALSPAAARESAMDTVLQVQHLTKQYKRSHLGRATVSRGVIDLSFAVRPGEVFGLLGLNGSGKTTTLKLVLGLLFPTSGEVTLFGHPIPSTESQRRT